MLAVLVGLQLWLVDWMDKRRAAREFNEWFDKSHPGRCPVCFLWRMSHSLDKRAKLRPHHCFEKGRWVE